MADIKYYDVILKPIITEKSMDAMSEKKYTFLVHTDATKSQVREDVRRHESEEREHHELRRKEEKTRNGHRQDGQDQKSDCTAYR